MKTKKRRGVAHSTSGTSRPRNPSRDAGARGPARIKVKPWNVGAMMSDYAEVPGSDVRPGDRLVLAEGEFLVLRVTPPEPPGVVMTYRLGGGRGDYCAGIEARMKVVRGGPPVPAPLTQFYRVRRGGEYLSAIFDEGKKINVPTWAPSSALAGEWELVDARRMAREHGGELEYAGARQGARRVQ